MSKSRPGTASLLTKWSRDDTAAFSETYLRGRDLRAKTESISRSTFYAVMNNGTKKPTTTVLARRRPPELNQGFSNGNIQSERGGTIMTVIASTWPPKKRHSRIESKAGASFKRVPNPPIHSTFSAWKDSLQLSKL